MVPLRGYLGTNNQFLWAIWPITIAFIDGTKGNTKDDLAMKESEWRRSGGLRLQPEVVLARHLFFDQTQSLRARHPLGLIVRFMHDNGVGLEVGVSSPAAEMDGAAVNTSDLVGAIESEAGEVGFRVGRTQMGLGKSKVGVLVAP